MNEARFPKTSKILVDYVEPVAVAELETWILLGDLNFVIGAGVFALSIAVRDVESAECEVILL